MWGRGDERLGLGETQDALVPTIVNAFRSRQLNIVRVCAGEEHSLAVSREGLVLSWGKGKYGKLGKVSKLHEGGEEDNESTPVEVKHMRGTQPTVRVYIYRFIEIILIGL